ncbi:hypothetical protein BHE74_00000151 [Ensete ventricosum]|nr:hypothetical protein BHE74_00000151 [Ensete ventricosum]
MDWPQYADYFDSISVEQGPFISYNENTYKLAFEFGYFLLNYITKYLGGGVEMWVGAVAILFTATYVGSNFYALLSQTLPSAFTAKLMEYATWDYALSARTYLFGLYIVCCALNLAWLERRAEKQFANALPFRKGKLVLNLAITSLMLSATFVLLFPNNFALWTRTFNVACVLFACALSTYYYSAVRHYKLLLLAHLLAAAIAFMVSLDGAAEAMIPYKTFF